MLRIGVMVSGGGTNLQAILDRIGDGTLCNCAVAAVVASNNKAYAIKRAEQYNIPSMVISRKNFTDLDEYDDTLLEHMGKYNVDLIVLAGFLSLLGPSLVKAYKNRIINIHPSLIPAFCGKGYYGIIPHQRAIEYGVKITGATVHFVDAEYDSGPIILQKSVEVMQGDTPESLQKRVMEEAEWKILPESIKLFSEGRLRVEGRRVVILDN